jgi:hypothetical protein
MRPEEFKSLLDARPFVPFRVFLTDGKTYDVLHPEFVWVLRARVDIAVPADPRTGIVDHVDHCSLLHIVRVEDLQTSPH